MPPPASAVAEHEEGLARAILHFDREASGPADQHPRMSGEMMRLLSVPWRSMPTAAVEAGRNPGSRHLLCRLEIDSDDARGKGLDPSGAGALPDPDMRSGCLDRGRRSQPANQDG